MTKHIAWVTPWNGRSAIARFGQDILAALLERGHSVDVWRSEAGAALGLPALPAPGRVAALQDADLAELWWNYDAVIVNLGDYFDYHGAALPLLAQGAGRALTILHDAQLIGLCSGWAAGQPDPEAFLRQLVAAIYGPGVLPADAPYWTTLEDMAATRPMIEYFAGQSAGAIVHGSHYIDRVRAACPGPVIRLPLPYPARDLPPAAPFETDFTVITVGHINANKRADAVLAAIGASAVLRSKARYRLIGPIEDSEKSRLLDVARQHFAPPPDFTGWASDSDLSAALAGASAVCCLRSPILEGGSASLVEAMLSARPVLVSNAGHYADIPDEAVLKCAPGEEAADVQRHLEALLADPDAARAQGERGRAYALETFSAQRYVDAMLPWLEEAIERQPAISTAAALGRTLGEFGVAEADPVVARLAEALDGLLVRPQPSGCEPGGVSRPDPAPAEPAEASRPPS